jgi:hypothetical protein
MSLNNSYFLPFEALLSLHRMPGMRGRWEKEGIFQKRLKESSRKDSHPSFIVLYSFILVKHTE